MQVTTKFPPKNFLSKKRVIITGGTGFIGSHLLTEILKQKPERVLILSQGSDPERIRAYLPQIQLKEYHSASNYVKAVLDSDADYLFILGGNADPRLSLADPKMDLELNLLHNFQLLDALKKKEPSKLKIVYISSVAVYGKRKNELLKEESATIPMSPYGMNKLAVEGYIRFFSETSSVKGFSIRLFSTYGPQLRKQVVYDFVRELLRDPENFVVRGDGKEVRDLSYVSDQVDGILMLARKAAYTGEVYNLGSGVGISIADLAKRIAKLMDIKPKIHYKKEDKELHHGQVWVADISKTRRLGHVPKTQLDEGLRKTITWIKKS